MSYPPGASRSCHEADGRSDRSGGSSGRGFHHHQPAHSKCADNASSSVVITSNAIQDSVVASYPTLTYTTMVPTVGSSCTASGDQRPNWSNWTLGLESLLQDTEGVALFKTYLQYEGCANLLDFWFACQGFRSKIDPSDDRKILQLIKVIYRTYIRCSSTSTSGSGTGSSINAPHVQPIRLRAETRRLISERISRKHGLDQTVFDPAQTEVEHFLRTTAYPAFLKSDVYVEFLQNVMKDNRIIPQHQPYHHQQHFYYHQTPPRQNWSNTSMMMIPMGIQQAANVSDYRFPSSTIFASAPGSGTGNTVTPKTLPTVDEDRELRSEELTSVTTSTDADQFPGSLHHQPPPPPSVLFTGSGDFGRYIHEHHPTCACCPPRNYMVPDNGMPWTSPVIPHGGPISFMLTAGMHPLTVDDNQANRLRRTDYPIGQHVQQQQSAIRPTQYQLSEMVRVQSSLAGPRASAPGRLVHRQYTHWADSICPTAAGAHLSSAFPTVNPQRAFLAQPPNPYHSSYAPVSARDSERHSLSSGGARTDDAISHTDSSSHESSSNQAHRLCRCSQQHHRGQHYCVHHHLGQFPSSRLHHPSSSSRRHHQQQHQQQQQQITRESGDAWMPQAHTGGTPRMVSSPPEVVSTTAVATGSESRQHTRRSSTGRRVAVRSGAGAGASSAALLLSDSNAQEQAQQHQQSNNNRTTGLSKPTGSSARSHNLAERDPQAFFNLLSEKLQRVLDNQLTNERLDHLMASTNAGTTNETSPNASQPEVTSASTAVTVAAAARDSAQSTSCSTATATTTVATVACSVSAGLPTSSSTATVATSSEAVAVGSQNRLTSELLPASSVLRRPWADRLLAAARVQHENTKDDAQAILEDHCSRIWAASADRTPTTSSGSGDSPADMQCDSSAVARRLNPDQQQLQQQTGRSSHLGLLPAGGGHMAGDASAAAQRARPRRHPGNRHSNRLQPSQSVGGAETGGASSSSRRQRSRSKKKQPTTRLGDSGGSEMTRQRFADYEAEAEEEECEEEEMSGSKLLTELLPDSAFPCSASPSAPLSLASTTAAVSGRPALHASNRLDPRTKELMVSSSSVSGSAATRSRDFCLQELQQEVEEQALSSHSSSPLVAMTTAPLPGLTTTSDSAESTAGGCLQSHLFASNSHSSSSGGGGVAAAVVGGALAGLPETAIPMATTTTIGATTSSSSNNTSSSSMSGGGTPLVIGYYLGDDPVPYRSLWPGPEITLGQFKQLIPKKKGSFRFFFKKASDEFECGVVHQEVTHDDCILPLWEGKVVAKVERVD